MIKLNKGLSLAIGVSILIVFSSFGQDRKVRKADKKYIQIAFMDAIAYYEQAVETGYRSELFFSRLANAHYFNANYSAAAKWYKELFVENPDPDSIYHLRYAQCLLSIGEREMAKGHYKTFMEGAEHKALAIKDVEQQIKANSGRYELKLLDFNSDGVDFGSAVSNGKLVFASSRDKRSLFKRKSAWDGLSFLDLYEVGFDENKTFGKPTKFKGDINSKYHESTVAFSKDGKTMYFTRNTKKPKDFSDDGLLRLKIYRAHMKKGKWTDVEELPINGENFSTAHPALNSDDTRLYFVSDRPESIGETDIFYVPIHPDGSLGGVVALGDTINTIGRESFPYLTSEDELYFSSDGHYGLGGYDVFYSIMDGANNFKAPINVGSPINSTADDVCFVVDGHKGYVSSNRSGGPGYDDIYSFTETEDIRNLLKSRIFGVVTNNETKQALPHATVTIIDTENTIVASLSTDKDGRYEKEVNLDTDYIIKAVKPDFEGDDAFSNAGVKDREHNFELVPQTMEFMEGDDLAKILDIVIYFDLDKSNIRTDAALELEKLISVMEQYPKLKIVAQCHTDSRANDVYNMALSERRARSIVDFMISKGVSRERISGKGFGETELVNDCGNNVNCTEAEHQENRRGEFIVDKVH